MVERDYKHDLRNLFCDVDRIFSKVKKQCQSIYQEEQLEFGEPPYPFRTVEGDIYGKVLGLYLQRVLEKKPCYEKKLVGRLRADVQFDERGPKVTIEVKSHGQFDSENLAKRFMKLTSKMPTSRHLYVAFREREDYVKKTVDILQPLNVSTFFLTTYSGEGKLIKTTNHPEELQRLVETVKAIVCSLNHLE